MQDPSSSGGGAGSRGGPDDSTGGPGRDPALPKGEWRIERIAAGPYHTCAIDDDERLYCWGAGSFGRTGHGDEEDDAIPRRVGTDAGWQAVAPTVHGTCGIRDRALYCWGIDWGDVPALASDVTGWTHVSGGFLFSCGIADGALYCWGLGYEALGLGSPEGSSYLTETLEPKRVGQESDWTAVSAGVSHTCGIRDGKMFCWGDLAGNYGTETDKRWYPYPIRVGELADWKHVAAGDDNSMGIRDGALYRWGSFYNSLDLDEEPEDGVFRRQGKTHDWSYIESARGADIDWYAGHACGLRSTKLICWGLNDDGQLGVPPGYEVHEFTEAGWDAVAVSFRHTCGINAGLAYCWGSNEAKQLGSGEDEDGEDDEDHLALSPVAVAAPTD